MQSIIFIILMFILGGCTSTKLTIPEYIPVYVEAKPSKLLQIPYPIVLLHGLGQKASVWDKHAIKFYEKDLGLKHAGILKPSKKGIYLDQKGSSSTILTIFSNGIALELAEFLLNILCVINSG